MDFIKKRDNPNYNFTWQERKLMRALWLKNAPMSYEHILGACTSSMWPEEQAQIWIDRLLRKGVIKQLKDGTFDTVLDCYAYKDYLRKRKLYTLFYPDTAHYPASATASCFHLGAEPEHALRQIEKLLESRKTP